ncbi:MAG: SpoVR family protein [Oligoflexia bacterium]|nr:SpoVR family protein [Oligoflexia bacterium]MBF0366683.1 SpoVR family protein [Oligoflexia bacterium]
MSVMEKTRPISGELLELQKVICQYAVDYGLSFYEVIFELCDYETVNILAAQGGFPTRYPHWKFGMDYDQFSKGYAYGVQKIYEMVINTDPCYAYLLNANYMVDQKTVMAHVYGHADFFKNNYWFSTTNRKMMDTMANHRTKIRRYMEQHGSDVVEQFIDKVLSLDNLIDISALFETPELQRERKEIDKQAKDESLRSDDDDRSEALRSFMRSPYYKDKDKDKGEHSKKEHKKHKDKHHDKKSVKEDQEKEKAASLDPNNPTAQAEAVHALAKTGEIHKAPSSSRKDIMQFLAQHAPLTEWQSDVISILREEAYYFLPQRLTKIMNEGWASYWHSRIMTEKAACSSEITDFADHHSGIMQMSRKQLNPYKVGLELFRDIEYRWNTGRFGKEYNECENLYEKEHWDLRLKGGQAKIFDVRRSHNDITFIDEFLTPEFCNRQQIFTYKFNPRTGRNEIDTRDFLAIKQKLLTSLTNFGSPVIEIENGNYNNRGEILLCHRHYGVDLDLNYAHDTMKNIFAIWRRPINLATKYDNKEVIFIYDGKEMRPLT